MADDAKKARGARPADDAARAPGQGREPGPGPIIDEAHGTIASGTGDTSVAPGKPAGVPANRAAAPPVPTEFGRYQIIRTLGKGAMGTVYLAEDKQLARQVALKIPQLDESSGGARLERFFREARLAATLSHPNICPIFDVGQHDGTHYISMAYIRGKPLDALLKPAQPLSERTAASLVRKLALALFDAHSNGVVHRDLKPANIMVDQRGEPIIMDFGLARRVNSADQAQLTHDGAIIGTPSYMSPEQVQGNIDAVGAASDIYGLGVILYQLLTGRLPFQGPLVSVLAQIATQTPPPPSSFREHLHPELEAICLEAMAKRTKDRYASMADFAAALSRYLRNVPPAETNRGDSGANRPPLPHGEQSPASLAVHQTEAAAPAGPIPRAATAIERGARWKWRDLSPRVRRAAVCSAAAVAVVVILLVSRGRDGGTSGTDVALNGKGAVGAGPVPNREGAGDSAEGLENRVFAGRSGAAPLEVADETDGETGASEDGDGSTDDEPAMDDTQEMAETAAPDDSGAEVDEAQPPETAGAEENAAEAETQTDTGAKKSAPARKKARPARVVPGDALVAGSVWSGGVTQWVDGKKDPVSHEFTISVIERNKTKFKATLNVGNGALIYDFNGVIRQNAVEWTTIDATIHQGTVGRHRFGGVISKGGRLEFQYSGSTLDFKATRGVGTANLRVP